MELNPINGKIGTGTDPFFVIIIAIIAIEMIHTGPVGRGRIVIKIDENKDSAPETKNGPYRYTIIFCRMISECSNDFRNDKN